MKKLFICLAALAAFQAQAAALCQPIEFAELQTYTTQELKDLARSYMQKGSENIGKRYLEIEVTNCTEQFSRVYRIINAREAKEQETK